MKMTYPILLSAIFLASISAAGHTDQSSADVPTAIYQWSDTSGKTVFGDAPPKESKNIRRIEIPDPNIIQPPPKHAHAHAEESLSSAGAAPSAKPALSPRAQRRTECNAKLKEADDYEKSDRSDLARNIYPWIVANCPENRTGRIGGRIRLVPAPEIDEATE